MQFLLGTSAALVPIVDASAEQVSELERLWRARLEIKAGLDEIQRKLSAAQKRLPRWAAIGPKYMNVDGTYDEEHGRVGWPEVQNPKPPQAGSWSLVRPSLEDIKHRFKTSPFREHSGARAAYRKNVRAWIARYRQQQEELRKVGIPGLEALSDRLSDDCIAIENRIESMCGPAKYPELAAYILILMDYEDEHAPVRVLDTIRDQLPAFLQTAIDEALAPYYEEEDEGVEEAA